MSELLELGLQGVVRPPDLNLRPLEEQHTLLTLGHLSILTVPFSSRNPELCRDKSLG